MRIRNIELNNYERSIKLFWSVRLQKKKGKIKKKDFLAKKKDTRQLD
jgi:hypothetical protein